MMSRSANHILRSAIFVTFPGNCRVALSFYHSCFGGKLLYETLNVEGIRGTPVVSGSLISDRVIIHGSDMVPEEGRVMGNCISVYLPFKDHRERRSIIAKLQKKSTINWNGYADQKLIEILDPFDISWILGIN